MGIYKRLSHSWGSNSALRRIIKGESGKRGIVTLIAIYRSLFSGLKMRPTCRFYPSCSLYAMEAIDKYGTWKGLYLAVRRLLRCHPFNPGGYDPVK